MPQNGDFWTEVNITMAAREGDIERLLAHRWTGGRCYKRYPYTVKTVAEAANRSIGTVRNDICKGLLRMEDLQSVGCYIAKHAGDTMRYQGTG